MDVMVLFYRHKSTCWLGEASYAETALQDGELELGGPGGGGGYVLHNKRSSAAGLVDQMELLNMTPGATDGTTYGSVWSGRTPPPTYTSDHHSTTAGDTISNNTTVTANTLSIGGGCGEIGRYPSVDSAPTPIPTPPPPSSSLQTKLTPCRACIVRGGGDHMYESPRVGENSCMMDASWLADPALAVTVQVGSLGSTAVWLYNHHLYTTRQFLQDERNQPCINLGYVPTNESYFYSIKTFLITTSTDWIWMWECAGTTQFLWWVMKLERARETYHVMYQWRNMW